MNGLAVNTDVCEGGGTISSSAMTKSEPNKSMELSRRRCVHRMMQVWKQAGDMKFDAFVQAVRLFDACIDLQYGGNAAQAPPSFDDTALCCLFIIWRMETGKYGKDDATKFSALTGDSISAGTLLSMERDIAYIHAAHCGYSTFDISYFVYLSGWGLDDRSCDGLQVMYLIFYLWELALLDKALLTEFSHNVIGAAISFVACFTISPSFKPWTERLRRFSGLEARDLQNCVQVIRDLQTKKRGIDEHSGEVRSRYSRDEVGRVANMPLASTIPLDYFE